MAKQLNISLGFSADTSQAKQQIQSLQQTLNQLVSNSTKSVVGQKMPITKELIEAQQAAGQLEAMLKQCTNVNTQKLDLTKFQESLKTAGMSLPQLKTQLESLGPAGSKAFMQLSQSIMTAEVPLTRTNVLLAETWNTLKNTARWQISSSILHGFMGAVSTAYGYAQDLDESLNNIRIVTGKNSEEMARFAEQANNAAKALNTTTTKYTDASLIYYQQGLDDAEVQARTDITVKMANAAGQSAEIVSDQLTAIWNNFYDGSKSLEYYADVMTALGAATASSTDEIAGGLEKFAAIGETIGLSYEYAASALATITSNTRQSEEVVGTALKTIFARIQGLNLGETLEDGVTLNKYSEALEKVGISIFDQTGELKAMDDILDEMASKWDVLSSAQQTALAQTVAGVRQYTQLIALMENWDNGDNDSMTANLATSYGASGTLDEQAAIYAEGWEAARDRVTAAAEDLYDSLLDEEFFIKMLDGLETVISGIARFVDSLGGLPGILSLVGALMTKIFSRQISTSIDNMIYGIRSLIGETQRSAQAFKEQAYSLANDFTFDTGTDAGAIQGQAWKDRLTLQKDIEIISENLTENEKEQLEKALQLNDQYAERARTLAEIKDKATQQVQDTGRDIRAKVSRAEGTEGSDATLVKYRNTREVMDELIKKGMSAEKALKSINSKASSGSRDFDKYGKEIDEVATHLTEIGRGGASAKLKEMFTKFKNGQMTAEGFSSALKKIVTEEDILQDTTIAAADELYDMAKSAGVTQQECDKLANEMLDLAQKTEVAEEGAKQYVDANEKIKQSVTGFKDSMNSFGQNITTTMNGISSLVMGIQSIKSAFETLSNPDLSFGEKVLQITMSMTMAIPALISAMQVLNKEQLKKNLADMKDVALGASKVATMLLEKLGLGGLIAVKGADTAATAASSAANITWQATAWPIVLITLAIVAALVVLIGTVALVVAAFNAWKNSTPEAKLAAAKEESARLSEELNKAKEAADSLRQSIEAYDSAVDKIKTLKRGTEEWKQAIQEANDKARELIDKGGLEGQYSFNAETGLIEFKEGALEGAQNAADQHVKTVQAQKLMADNSVLTNQTAVANKDVATAGSEDRYMAGGITYLAGSLIPALGPVVAALGAVAIGLQKSVDNDQTIALENLQEAFEDNGGNLALAIDSLSAKDQALIASLDMTDAELEKLCQETSANTQAILENNKQIVDSTFEGNKDYERSSNKEFLNEVLAVEMTDETERLYEEQYKDGKGMTDQQAQEAYATMMGWDANLVDNQSGNKAVYIDNEGNEVTISDEKVRQYLAQQAALDGLNESMKDYADKVDDLNEQEEDLAKQYQEGKITYAEYIKEMEKAGKSLGFTSDNIESYIKNHSSENIQRRNREVDLAKNLADAGLDENTAMSFTQQFSKDLTDEELEIAVNVSATSESMDDFKRQFQIASTEALLNSFESTSSNIENMLSAADEQGSFSSADFITLEQDENFVKWMEENQMSMVDIVSASYTEQYNIISKFYSDLQQMQYENMELQKQNYESDVAEYQAILDYKIAQEENNAQRMKEIQDAWGSSIDFEAYMDLDTDDLQEKLDEARAGIEELTNKQYEINMSWDGIDQLEKSFDDMGNFAKTIEKDAKKVGNSYQITAAQGREWMEMYPELFATAEVTTDGLIQLSEAEYEAFAAAEKQKRDEAIETEIENLKLRLEQIPLEKERLTTQLEMYKTLKEGEMNLEHATAEDLVAVRGNLTQFYIDSGLDEVTANSMALQAMGLSQEEYNRMIADSTEQNAKNTTEGANKTVQNVKTLFSNLINHLKNVFANLGAAIKAIFTGDWDSIGSYMSAAWSAAQSSVSGVKNDFQAIRDGTMDNYKIGDNYTKYESQAEFEDAKNKALDDAIADMEASIAKLDNEENMILSKINYLQASQNQDVSDYGSTDPDEVDGTKDNKDKDIEELEEILERYHEITREVETLEHELSMLEKQKDRTFGANKIKAMEKEIAAMEKLALKQEELYKAQLVYLALDKQKVLDTFAGAKFDGDGNISNYSDLQQSAVDELNRAKTQYNSSAQTDADKKALEAAEKKYEDQIAILEQYEETLDATRESEETMQEAFFNWQDANADLLNYKLEIDIEINDDELKELEYYLSKTEDDFYARGESMGIKGDSVEVHEKALKRYEEQYDQLQKDYAAGKISQDAYISGLQECSDGMYEHLEAINDLDKEMLHYYGDTLAAAGEEIDKTTSRMEHQTEVLDHYRSVVDLMGKSNDYVAVGTILEGKKTTTKAEMDAAKKEFDLYSKEANDKYNLWQAALESGNTDAAEMYKQQYEDALAAADEAQSEYLSKAESYAETLKEILENSLNQYAQSLENSLTGGTSFDQINAQLERAASLQEEYLTTTNKIYETNKLMNQAQQEIDKTSNSVAKRKLKSFIDETNQLQQQGKLSQYELEIQQAKYDLLLAEIAVEEAQQAKSTVRLQRDSEGNFGYVYTADSSQIAAAEQELADKQNSLYNIALEGANGYTEKYMSTLNEMYSTLTDLQQQYLSGSFESEEEYNNAVIAAKEYYYEKLEEYSNLHSIAINADTRVIGEAWSSEFNEMISNTETWQLAVDEYVDLAAQAFRDWDSEMDDLAGDVGLGGDLGSLESAVGDVTTETEKLNKEFNNTVKEVEKVIDSVDKASSEYLNHQKVVDGTIEKYEQLATSIDDAKRAAQELKAEQQGNLDDNSNSGSGSGGSGSGSGSSSGGSGSGSGSGSGGDGIISVGDEVTYTGGYYYNTSQGDSPKGNRGPNKKVKVTRVLTNGAPYPIAVESSDSAYGWLKKEQLSGFDTGGYTGAWGSYGKMAMLHEKELVLNKQDTENFLTSMEFLDNIIKTIDLQAANSALGGLLSSPSFGDFGQKEILEQNVKIEASFPNVQNRTEIEEAFETLVNRASQYANRK